VKVVRADIAEFGNYYLDGVENYCSSNLERLMVTNDCC
jgi:hypothetical protein